MGLHAAGLTQMLLTAACISVLSDQTRAQYTNGGTDLPSKESAACPRKHNALTRKPQFCALLLDDQSPPLTWEPWAYRPNCVLENRSEGVGHDSGEGSKIKYCLYTNTFFGEHGISILARPEAAAQVSNILQDAYHSNFPSPETVQYFNLEPAYRVVDMPEKGGKGLIATRHIKRRETFMVDWAAITGDLKIWGSVSQKDGLPLLDRAAEQLVDPTQVLALSRGAGGDGVEGIIKANTFRTYLDGVPQKTLFPRISRINHACQPNSMLRFSKDGIMAGVGAFRDIKPGEEITISYIDLTDTSKQREMKLEEWGFACSCDLCKAPAAQIAASDRRREKLAKGIGMMVEALQEGDAGKAIRILQNALTMLREEGLEPVSAEVHEGLARIYWAVGDKKTGKEYARKAVDYHADFDGSLAPSNRTADLEIMLQSFDS